MSVQHIGSKQEFESAIRDSNYNATIVDFTATWLFSFTYCWLLNPEII
jgi:hypothetical protein